MTFGGFLIRLGTILSRILLAIGTLLLLTSLVIFVKTGSWTPFSLGGTLAFYGMSVPNSGLSGLVMVYSLLGSVWLFCYFMLGGFALALISAKAAPQSTVSYLQAIILLPITAVHLTIGGFFLVIRGLIKYTLFTVVTALVVTCLWWGTDFALHANKLSAGESCNLRQQVFGDVTFNFLFKCADASRISQGGKE